MAKTKIEPIFIKEWLEIKPYSKSKKTDSYYLKIANKIKKLIFTEITESLWEYISKEDINLLSIFLVSYFEDIISNCGIWKTFINKHTELYGKKLPFYNIDEYFDDEINETDIKYLIWYFLSVINIDIYINPNLEEIIHISEKIFELLDEEYDYAPENKDLRENYIIPENETDFYKIRGKVENYFLKNYLLIIDTEFRFSEKIFDVISEKDSEITDEYKSMYFYKERISFIHNAKSKLLALSAGEWAAEMNGKNHSLYNDLSNISEQFRGIFLYKKSNEKYLVLEHIASGIKINLLKSTVDHYEEFEKDRTILQIDMVKWQNEWVFSGLYNVHEFELKMYNEIKNDISELYRISFMFYENDRTKEFLEKREKAFLEYNNNSLIAYTTEDKVGDYVKDFTEYFKSNYSVKGITDLHDILVQNLKFEQEELEEESEISSAIVFLNKYSGLEVIFDVEDAFKNKDNVIYGKNYSDTEFIFTSNSDTSTELIEYFIENYSDGNEFINELKVDMVFKDLDFLLRFWKFDNYKSRPAFYFTEFD